MHLAIKFNKRGGAYAIMEFQKELDALNFIKDCSKSKYIDWRNSASIFADWYKGRKENIIGELKDLKKENYYLADDNLQLQEMYD